MATIEAPSRPVTRVAEELAKSSGFLLVRLGLAFKAKALELNNANREGLGITTSQVAALLRLTEAQELLNRTQAKVSLGTASDDEIKRVITRGTLRDGTRLLPFPMDWPSFSTMKPDDIDAIVAYLRTVPPVRNKVPGPKWTFLPVHLW